MAKIHVTLLFIAILTGVIASPVRGGTSIQTRLDGPTCSPDGERVAFAIVKDRSEVAVLDFASGSMQGFKVPGRLVEAFYGMSWSPDGTFIVATVVEHGKKPGRFSLWNLPPFHGNIPGPFSLWKLTPSTHKWQKLADIPYHLCQRALISPKGQTVLYRDARSRNLNLLDLTTAKRKQLTKTGDVYRLGYAWSPNGSNIYFSRGYMTENGGLWVMNANGANKKELSMEQEAYSLGVSETEEHIAFTVSNGSLFVASLSDLQTVKISEKAGYFFQWHPLQEKLVFQEETSIKTWSASGSGDVPHTLDVIGDGYFPIWAEGGAAIVFLRDTTDLWRYEVRSRTSARIYTLEAIDSNKAIDSD